MSGNWDVVVFKEIRIGSDIIEFIPVGVFDKADNFGFLLGTRRNIEHDVAMI